MTNFRIKNRNIFQLGNIFTLFPFHTLFYCNSSTFPQYTILEIKSFYSVVMNINVYSWLFKKKLFLGNIKTAQSHFQLNHCLTSMSSRYLCPIWCLQSKLHSTTEKGLDFLNQHLVPLSWPLWVMIQAQAAECMKWGQWGEISMPKWQRLRRGEVSGIGLA